MDIIDERRVKIQSLSRTWYGDTAGCIDMLRLDLLHPVISGNKWYKLRLNMLHAQEQGIGTIVTFGGGFSNHLAAAAYAAKVAGLRAIGIIRGKYDKLTPTLEECARDGMELIFTTQADYARKDEPGWLQEIAAHFDEVFIIPEGGANEWGRKGAELICRFISNEYSHIIVSVGSGTTMAGIRNKADVGQKIIGMVPMKDGVYLHDHIRRHLHPGRDTNWALMDNWHFGGFARVNEELIAFMNDFYKENNIPLDMVYTAKMMYGVRDLLKKQYFNFEDRILCIHSGGLQGNSTIQQRLLQPVPGKV